MELTNINNEDEIINTEIGNSLKKPIYKDNINYNNRKLILFNKIKRIPFIVFLMLIIFLISKIFLCRKCLY